MIFLWEGLSKKIVEDYVKLRSEEIMEFEENKVKKLIASIFTMDSIKRTHRNSSANWTAFMIGKTLHCTLDTSKSYEEQRDFIRKIFVQRFCIELFRCKDKSMLNALAANLITTGKVQDLKLSFFKKILEAA